MLLSAGTLALAAWLLPNTAPADSARSRITAALRPPTVSLTIEPMNLMPTVETEQPVVLPGYLLPDDGAEEPAHAGG
jgi:hypothetical protein